MDKATPAGLLLGVGLILVSIALGGGGLMPFIDAPSLLIVVGGSIAATLINFPLADVLRRVFGRPELFLCEAAGSSRSDRHFL